ncbi:translation factor [Ectocarpus siliculosus]|uniref:Threonylcarbamoyl-AMP synthase n=1 Tax=Ectocarpus siliculosus TaxID=2880 RepID=D8LIB5_ECTSI|nr:translation factor [Ectocarpus siliculosus]|eukprot:CBN79418.1 translation factor [Ectocarpus siliculosus]
MKARGKKGRGGGGRQGGKGDATARAAGRAGTKQKKAALYIQIEDLESDSWRLIEAGNILRKGGVGVIPTDTCYTFACDILSRKGVERILQIKNEQGRHKPLSLLCKDISTMNTYAKGIDKVPRMLIEHKHHKKTWKRKEIGIRLPNAPVLLDLLQQLDGCGHLRGRSPRCRAIRSRVSRHPSMM